MVLALCLVLALICLVACKGEDEPQDTTAEDNVTTDGQSTAETTSSTPSETVTFPSEEDDNDPKQEDVFFD